VTEGAIGYGFLRVIAYTSTAFLLSVTVRLGLHYLTFLSANYFCPRQRNWEAILKRVASVFHLSDDLVSATVAHVPFRSLLHWIHILLDI